MSGVLKEWFTELRAEGVGEQEAVSVIAGRLNESPAEARRVLVSIGRVKLGGRPSAPVDAQRATAGAGLDVARVKAQYRAQREGGADPGLAAKLTAKRLGARPHDVRVAVADVELELREHV